MFDTIFEKTADELASAWKYPTVIDWYNDNSAPNEVNILARFATAISKVFKDATAFYEVRIDGGRIDLVIISPEVVLIVEGKTTFHSNSPSLIRSLNKQIERIHSQDGGMLRLIHERIPAYCKERWNLAATPPIYVMALAWCHSGGLDAWDNSPHWSSELREFQTGRAPFTFSGGEHYLVFKYRKTNGLVWQVEEGSPKN